MGAMREAGADLQRKGRNAGSRTGSGRWQGTASIFLSWAGDAGHGEVVGGEFEDDLLALLERIGEGGVGGEVGDDVLAIGKEGDPCAAVWAWGAEGAGGADGIGGWHGWGRRDQLPPLRRRARRALRPLEASAAETGARRISCHVWGWTQLRSSSRRNVLGWQGMRSPHFRREAQ